MLAKNYILLIILVVTISFQSCKKDQNHILQSPDGEIGGIVTDDNQTMKFSLTYKGGIILEKSVLGLMVDSVNLTEGITVLGIEQSSFNETWETVNGKNKEAVNHYNEYIFKCLKSGTVPIHFNIVFRCYDNGVAFRYVIHKQENIDSLKVNDDLTVLNFAGDFTFWAANAEHHNLGPLKRSETKLDKIFTPLVLKTNKHVYVAIHEAATVDLAPFYLKTGTAENSLEFILNTSVGKTPLETSWRTLMLGDKPGDLVESDLLTNLNPPCKIEDTSWIKPGKSMWDWRVWGYMADDGFEYGLNTISHKRFIDFAAQNNIQYLLIDADWYGDEFSEDSNPTSAREGVNIEECMAYANGKGVGIILYLNDVGAKRFGLERVLKQFSEWGAVGVKYGFMKGKEQEKVLHTRKVVELCAKYKLMVDFHDSPIPPSGDRRTWPNMVTKEYCHAQADAKRSYFPETAVTAPFINMIAGPLDMTNGWFDLNSAHSRERVFQEIPGTVVAEVAKLIVVYSGWNVLPDSPEEYLKKDDLFDCIRKMPAQFDSFKVLDGEIGEFIVVARQSGSNWFVGALTNRDSRTVNVNFSFLPEGQEYVATFYEDAKETHFRKNKEAYQIREIEVDATTKTLIQLAPGGGHAMFIRQL